MPDLDALFRPRSIALVGASPDPSVIRGRIVEAVTKYGFDGTLHAVSRSHEVIAGIPCHPSVEALPGAVDLAIVTIPAEHVAPTLRACGTIGVRAAIVISSGFGEESGEAGRERQRAIAAIAREFDMAVLGPNAEGLLNGAMPLAATFSPAVVHVENGLRPEGSRARAFAPAADIRGVRVEAMAGEGVEVIVGVSADSDFGPMLAVGLGGVLVEVLDDVVLSPAPVDAPEARRMLRRLRGAQLFDGVRGAPPADVDALVSLLVAVSEFVTEAGGALEALDLNPVIVHRRGGGVTVADASIVTGGIRRCTSRGEQDSGASP